MLRFTFRSVPRADCKLFPPITRCCSRLFHNVLLTISSHPCPFPPPQPRAPSPALRVTGGGTRTSAARVINLSHGHQIRRRRRRATRMSLAGSERAGKRPALGAGTAVRDTAQYRRLPARVCRLSVCRLMDQVRDPGRVDWTQHGLRTREEGPRDMRRGQLGTRGLTHLGVGLLR